MTKSLVKISWAVFEIFSQHPRNTSIFQLSHFDDVIKSTGRWRHQTFFVNLYRFLSIVYLCQVSSIHDLTWNSQVKRGRGEGNFSPSLFRLTKSPVQIGLMVLAQTSKELWPRMDRNLNWTWSGQQKLETRPRADLKTSNSRTLQLSSFPHHHL